MPFDTLFRIANGTALLCWIAIAFLPRRRMLKLAVQLVVVIGLCTLYAALIATYFFRVEAGGFFSLTAVQRLFESPGVALAGWLHYLAFDLLVGLWIAQRSDAIVLSRWIQAPLLLVTFIFGPLGLLLFASTAIAGRARQAWGASS